VTPDNVKDLLKQVGRNFAKFQTGVAVAAKRMQTLVSSYSGYSSN